MTASMLLLVLLSTAARESAPADARPALIPELARPCELRQPDDPLSIQISEFCKRLPDQLVTMTVTDLHALGAPLAQDQLDKGEDFQGFAIRSSAVVTPKASKSGALQRSLRSILTSPPTATPECFTPQHGLELKDAAGARFDVLVSFACSNYMVVSRAENWFYMGSFAVDERGNWDRLFHKAGIPADAAHK